MKVSELLRDESAKRVQFLKAKNLRYVCNEGVDIWVFRTFDSEEYYCEIVADSNIIAFFPVRGSIDTCKLLSRVGDVLNYLGYVKRIKGN